MARRIVPSSGLDGQLVSAFGERAAEAELLRRRWVTANINASIRNMKDFDLFAVKRGRSLQIRVKTCSLGQDVQYTVPRNREIRSDDIADTDFTIIVRMGASRDGDQFYIIPTRVVFAALSAWRTEALSTQKDDGHWVLRWKELRGGRLKPNSGFEKKWAQYLDAWDSLGGAV
jgi:hypothetical protein